MAIIKAINDITDAIDNKKQATAEVIELKKKKSHDRTNPKIFFYKLEKNQG